LPRLDGSASMKAGAADDPLAVEARRGHPGPGNGSRTSLGGGTLANILTERSCGDGGAWV
jgi:hypothetical protein